MVPLQDLVEEWLRLDQNSVTRNEIQSLWLAGNTEELEKRMRVRIEFGTAGLRGRMEAGWCRMNDLIVIQASQGLSAYVLAHVRNAVSRGVVIGHDHRHNSERWARLTAAAFIADNVKVHFLGMVHTPLVPFGVKKKGAACGVMITASHNPKQDNGYKVYWENAVQIIGPHDQGISDSIKANLEPRSWAVDDVLLSPLCFEVADDICNAYFDNLANLSRSRMMNETTHIKFVNTSMHGVSDFFVNRAFSVFGFAPYTPVKEQQFPDAEFPTVRFPNPEEKGSLDLSLLTADRDGALYVLAQDPDGDRFAAAEKCPNGDWTVFTGDQLGTIFATWTLDVYRSTGKPIERLAMVASTVSSKMIEAIAATEGFKFAECLTGFKFIGNTALDLVKQGFEVPFGYEEAIGFMFGSEIRDKDGVAATVTFAEIITSLHGQGKTATSYLQELYERYGFFQTSNSYFVCTDPLTVEEIFYRIRNFKSSTSISSTGPSYPDKIAGLTITSIIDLTAGYDSNNPPSYKPILPLSSGQMIQVRAGNKLDGATVVFTLRTSGTEPKIKHYVEGNGIDAQVVADLLIKVVTELGEVWLEAGKHNLSHP
ncbi:hypothetical protein L208DRAFT_1442614 [Tricholoma matsutake]|nr:hypothetical protein L208DRAFT_1442614 [Tricholoma matsutake 945]